MKKMDKIYLALPVLNESESLPELIQCLLKQDFKNFELVVCVNNYDHWWKDVERIDQCHDNQKSIEFLRTINNLKISVIDRSSVQSGWPPKKGGVGWARKTAMDYIETVADEEDIMVSIDADTFYPEDYLSQILDAFKSNSGIDGISIPYYHQLNNDETDRLILRYEIYMRYYLINMLMINNPYAFTALGSAMAVTVKAYRKFGGMTPVKSGEDFYFLQKLVKTGNLGVWADTIAYPSPRLSSRVGFGTGPALIKGKKGDWTSYPIYHHNSFLKVRQTFEQFSELYSSDVITPMDEFLSEFFDVEKFREELRKNYRDKENFVKAYIRKVDGLRILQFLRSRQPKIGLSDEECLNIFLTDFLADASSVKFIRSHADFTFGNAEITTLKELRDILFVEETRLRMEKKETLYHK